MQWLLIALILVYMAVDLILNLFLKNYGMFLKFLAWCGYVTLLVLCAFFLDADPADIIFFIIALLFAAAAFHYRFIRGGKLKAINAGADGKQNTEAEKLAAEKAGLEKLLKEKEEKDALKDKLADTEKALLEEKLAAAKKERDIALESQKTAAEVSVAFQDIKRDVREHFKVKFPENVEITEREDMPKTGSPLADTLFVVKKAEAAKSKSVCFGYVYKIANDSVKVIFKAGKTETEDLKKKYPILVPSTFPAGKNWYVLIIESKNYSKDDVFNILTGSKSFVEEAE